MWIKKFKMTSFLIEGCDCVGKTTLVNEFLKRYKKYKVIHCKAPPKNLSKRAQHDFCKKQYETILKQLKQNNFLLLDRFYLGEAVYAPIFRGYYPFYIRDFEKKLNKLDVKLVVLTCDPEIVLKRFDGKFITKQQIPAILKSFESQFYLSNVKNKVMINTSVMTPEEIYEKVVYENGTIERF